MISSHRAVRAASPSITARQARLEAAFVTTKTHRLITSVHDSRPDAKIIFVSMMDAILFRKVYT
jgi:hypothetical protein